MIIKPLIRSNICINAHPLGCAKEVENQIAYVEAKAKARGSLVNAPKNVLVLGCSTGYGLASRISAAFECRANTIGVSFEKEGTEVKSGTPGWYNNMAFERAAKAQGLGCVTFNGDAFSDDMRKRVIEASKQFGKFDLVIYSVASAVRVDPVTGEKYRSVLKPLSKTFSGATMDVVTGKFSIITAEVANEEETRQTVKVMGGEDWARWIKQLADADVLAKDVKTVAYSYIGPTYTHAIYRDGTIGAAKKDIERTAREIDAELKKTLGGEAYISVNKGLVTRSSAVIPLIPLYISILFKIMKANGTHEGCIEQMERLFAERLYAGKTVPTDEEHRIRIDERELDPKVQAEVAKYMPIVNEDNIAKLGDIEGYRHDFLATNGFDIAGIDYDADVARMDVI
jgi:enoyl-[acyl-carrier protein] reductase/trans-2-enoyl-CoA reductase (NAD+)